MLSPKAAGISSSSNNNSSSSSSCIGICCTSVAGAGSHAEVGGEWQQYGGASASAPRAKGRGALASTSRSTPMRQSVVTTAAAILFAGRIKGKTAKQLKELAEDLAADMVRMRSGVRQLERAVDEKEKEKQMKFAELSKKSGGAVLQWLLLKNEANFPGHYDAMVESARDELHDALSRVSELENKIALAQEALADSEAARKAQPPAALFVHFIPPPMRQPGKGDLPWIVHSSNGSGCHEARHVFFHSLSGFETFEGPPPEQVQGMACSCAIANHHLRGFGVVRWDGQDAIIENEGFLTQPESAGGVKPADSSSHASPASAMVNGHAYRELARRQSGHLMQAKEEIRRLRAMRSDYFKNRDEERQEALTLRTALNDLQVQYKELYHQHEILKVQHKATTDEWAKAFSEACGAKTTDGDDVELLVAPELLSS
jgi:hypothetical protein